MTHQVTNPSVVQTLDEMDFERGLWYPAVQGDMDSVEKILARGVDVNQTDKSGYTPLHYAVRTGNLAVVRRLLQAGAKVDVQTRAGQATPLHRAAAAGHLEVVKILLNHGAKSACLDNDGRTPLHRAAEAGHEAIALHLLKVSPQSARIRDVKGLLPAEIARGSLGDVINTQCSTHDSRPRSTSKSPNSRHRKSSRSTSPHNS